MLLAPYIDWIKAVAVLVAALGVLWTGHHFGAQGERLEREKERADALERTMATNRAILRGFENVAETNRREKQRAKVETDRLRADLRSGSVRLSVPVSACKQSNDPGTGNQQARAELVPTAADRIIAIAIDGDDTVRDLNACIDKYNAVKTAIEEGR